MGLSFGWKAHDIRESIWKDDDVFPRKEDGDVDLPLGAVQAWQEDGDASHLQPYVKNGQPSRITFRTLSPDEAAMVQAFMFSDNKTEGAARALLLCFRIGVDFPDAPDKFQDENGINRPRIVNERGVRMLSNGFVSYLNQQYPDIVGFYGVLIHKATFPTEPEKKASSPQSTPTPSSAVASTAATTAPPQSGEAATGAP